MKPKSAIEKCLETIEIALYQYDALADIYDAETDKNNAGIGLEALYELKTLLPVIDRRGNSARIS